MMGWVLCWTSGHVPPRSVFMRGEELACGATVRVDEAFVFVSRDAAEAAWLQGHRCPEDYVECLRDGGVRAERVGERMLNL